MMQRIAAVALAVTAIAVTALAVAPAQDTRKPGCLVLAETEEPDAANMLQLRKLTAMVKVEDPEVHARLAAGGFIEREASSARTTAAPPAAAHGGLRGSHELPSADPEVETSLGRVSGRWHRGVREFLGVPFASPPGRWLPPEAPQPWAPATWNATKVSPGCHRPATWYTLNPAMSEDCLYLNLWAPPREAIPKGKLAQVLVWVFGGGYSMGSGDCLQTRGDQLVRTFGDVIVITFNYRLNVFGFLGSEELRRYTREHAGLDSTGNFGFLDQVELLRWVKQHVAAFGGDPSRVMLFGESAGAGAISAHLTSPLSRGLFHRAALQSGGFDKWVAMPMQHAEVNYGAMVARLRNLNEEEATMAPGFLCGADRGGLECLLDPKLPASLLTDLSDDLAAWQRTSSDWDTMETSSWAPTVDGVALLDHPFHSLLGGKWNEMPLLFGMNMDDGTGFIDGCRDGADAQGRPTCGMDEDTYNELLAYFSDSSLVDDPGCFQDPLYRDWLRLNWGADNVEALFALYNSTPTGAFKTNYWAAEELVGDFIMHCTERRAVFAAAQAGAGVFQYNFAHTPNEAPFGSPPHDPIVDGFGACHGCEIPFVFNRNDSEEYGIRGDGEFKLGLAMAAYWTNFAWTGDPNDAGERWGKRAELPAVWPRKPEAAANRPITTALVFDAKGSRASVRLERLGRSDRCVAFWDPYFESMGWFPPANGGRRHHTAQKAAVSLASAAAGKLLRTIVCPALGSGGVAAKVL